MEQEGTINGREVVRMQRQEKETLTIRVVIPKTTLQTWRAEDVKEFMLTQAIEGIKSALKDMPPKEKNVF